jgi:hypothetical protein
MTTLYEKLNLPSPKETRATPFRNSEDEKKREKNRKKVETKIVGYCEGGKRTHTSHSEDLSELKNMIDELNLDKSQVKLPPYHCNVPGLLHTRRDGDEWGAGYVRILLEQYWGFVPRTLLFKDPLDSSETLYKDKVSTIINNLSLYKTDITKTCETLGDAGALGLIIVKSHEERMMNKSYNERYNKLGVPKYAQDKKWHTAINMGITPGMGIEECVEEARKLIKIEIINLSKCQAGSLFNSRKYQKDCFISELNSFNSDPLIPIGWRIQMRGSHLSST